MGTAAAKRAREIFEWEIIYQRYQVLWSDLAERRRADPDLYLLSEQVRPDRQDHLHFCRVSDCANW